jgi:hypothetical protein
MMIVYKITEVCDAESSLLKIGSVVPKKRRQCSPHFTTSHIRSENLLYAINIRRITTLTVVILTPEFLFLVK